MQGIHIGTSGWHYRHWRERFYPAELAPSAWLTYYAREFNCVELNSSFYRLPTETTLREWVEQTPADFRFAVKASRLITHRSKLHDCDAMLQTLLHRIGGLGSKLGPILLQLPPRWHVNPERLRAFLPHLPAEQRFAFEFRDSSWHTPEIYNLLRTYQVTFCQFDLGGFQSPAEITTDMVYIRLHGPAAVYAGSYAMQTLRTWARRLLTWRAEGKVIYLFFDNDQSGYAVSNARTLRELCEIG